MVFLFKIAPKVLIATGIGAIAALMVMHTRQCIKDAQDANPATPTAS